MSCDHALRIFPDPVLRTTCHPVQDFKSHSLSLLVRDLEKVLHQQPHGIGIAAPQIGTPLRVAIVDVSGRDPKAKKWILINPKIREFREEIFSREGCMSIPDYRGDIKRYKQVWVEWQDFSGRKLSRQVTGIEAICAQHEIDHLDGRLFIDHVASLKRDLIPRKHSI